MIKNNDEKILTIFRYTKFGQERVIASMNYHYLFDDDDNFAKTHEILYDKNLDIITNTDRLKKSDIYYTEAGDSYMLIKSLKGTYEACRLNRFKIKDINEKIKEKAKGE